MQVPITAQITYEEFMIDSPTFFDEMLEDGLIDEATVGSLAKWFNKRIVCDDFNFDVFYERQLELTLPRYNKLIRLENTEFDALVNTYRERQVVGDGSEISSGEASRSTSETDALTRGETVTRTPNLTTVTEGETSGTSNSTTSSEGSTSSQSTTESGTKSVSKAAPQSISYPQTPTDHVPSLDWQYPSAQSQSENESESSSSGTSSNEGSSSSSETGESETTQRETGTETTVKAGTDSRVKSGSESEETGNSKTTSDLIREQWTGREDLTPQEALKTAMAYVKTSSAFSWLKEQLEVCFLSVYDI